MQGLPGADIYCDHNLVFKEVDIKRNTYVEEIHLNENVSTG